MSVMKPTTTMAQHINIRDSVNPDHTCLFGRIAIFVGVGGTFGRKSGATLKLRYEISRDEWPTSGPSTPDRRKIITIRKGPAMESLLARGDDVVVVIGAFFSGDPPTWQCIL